MTVGVTPPVTESDPVAVALNDSTVQERLAKAARGFLSTAAGHLSPGQRYAEAEEIVQKAAMRAWEHRAKFDPSRDAIPWLVGYVVNVAREHVKKSARDTPRPPPAPPDLENLIVALGRSVGDEVADRAFVEQLLGRLAADERELIRFVYFESRTFAEIGERLGLKESTARLQHHRLLGRLQVICGAGEVPS